MKRVISMIVFLTFICTLAMPVLGAEQKQRVHDLAGLFTDEEIDDLETEAAALVDEIGMDYVILTTADKDFKSIRDYAENFYYEGNYGIGNDKSGLLLLIDMEDRTVYIATKGEAINYYNDSRLLNLTDKNDELYDCLSAEEFKTAVDVVTDGIRYYYNEGIAPNQHTYDENTGEVVYLKPQRRLSLFEALIAVLIPAVTAWTYVSGIKKQYAMKAEKKASSGYLLAYRADSAFAFAVSSDQLIDKKVTSRIIPLSAGAAGGSGGSRAGRSTIHTGSHGTFGGGGGGRHF